MSAPIIQIKRGAYIGITSFRAGEPAFTTDTFDFFIGLDNTLENNKFFGSHRYWNREDGNVSLSLNLVDKNGINKISVKSPNELPVNIIYTLPENPIDGYLLTTNNSGTLSWTNQFSSAILSGITTFSDTTDNSLGNSATGSIQIYGGVGIDKNITIGKNLSVLENSEFSGISTFHSYVKIDESLDILNDINVSGISTFIGVSTFRNNVHIDKNLYVNNSSFFINLNSTTINITGIGTVQTIDANVGTIDFVSSANVFCSGIVTANTFDGDLLGNSETSTYSNYSGISTYSEFSGISTYSSLAGVSTSVIGGISSVTQLSVSGISTLQNNLNVNGDINISDVGIGTTFTTSLQIQTPTSDRVITLPDATGTVALVAGNSGYVTYNSTGANAGNSEFTFDPDVGLTVVKDIKVGVDTSRGIILTSPNGTNFRLIVDNLGNLTAVQV